MTSYDPDGVTPVAKLDDKVIAEKILFWRKQSASGKRVDHARERDLIAEQAARSLRRRS